MHLEDLQPRCVVRGVHPDGLVTVVSVQWFGSEALELTYKRSDGTVGNQLLYREDEPGLELVAQGRPWAFDGDGALFRLVSEAQRIRLAHLFDPLLAVHTSVVDPLPHQITGVYDAMLPASAVALPACRRPRRGPWPLAGDCAVARLLGSPAITACTRSVSTPCRLAVAATMPVNGRLAAGRAREEAGACCEHQEREATAGETRPAAWRTRTTPHQGPYASRRIGGPTG